MAEAIAATVQRTDAAARPAAKRERLAGPEYVRLAALLGGVLAYIPLMGAWLTALGSRYYDVLLSGVGLNVAVLDLPDRVLAYKGYELVVGATNPLVAPVVFGLPVSYLAGLVLGGITRGYDLRRQAAGKQELDTTGYGRWIVLLGRGAFFALTVAASLGVLLTVVYVSPGLASDAADHQLNCARGLITNDCPQLLDYGNKAPAARLLAADKSHLYVYQGNSVRRLRLDDILAVYSGKRPSPALVRKGY